jgi:hypothetical protein
MFRVVCDRCGKCAQDDTDYYAWVDKDQAQDHAVDAEWLVTDDGHHYCVDCVEWNDDEDALVPIVAAPAPDTPEGT